MGPVYHELSLLLFLPHPAPEWDLSTGSQVPPGKLLQHRLISPHIHRSCQGSLLCCVLGFFCSVSFVLVFFMILRRKWKLVGLDVFIKRNRLSSYRVQGLFACKESAALMCFLGLFIHSLSWNIWCGNGSRPGKWSQTLLVWPLSESSCLWEQRNRATESSWWGDLENILFLSVGLCCCFPCLQSRKDGRENESISVRFITCGFLFKKVV